MCGWKSANGINISGWCNVVWKFPTIWHAVWRMCQRSIIVLSVQNSESVCLLNSNIRKYRMSLYVMHHDDYTMNIEYVINFLWRNSSQYKIQQVASIVQILYLSILIKSSSFKHFDFVICYSITFYFNCSFT